MRRRKITIIRNKKRLLQRQKEIPNVSKTYEDGITEAIIALKEFIDPYEDTICNAVVKKHSDWCNDNCKNLCVECIRKYINIQIELGNVLSRDGTPIID